MCGAEKRVGCDEIAALMREMARVVELGSAATEEELDAVRDWKIDLLERIAADPGPYEDPVEAERVRELAYREATALRLGLPSPWGGEPA